MFVAEDDMICANCVHRDYGHEAFLPVERPWGVSVEACCPCLKEACECDCGPAVIMFAEDGHCRFQAEAFEPCEEYLEMRASREEEENWEREVLANAMVYADMRNW